MQAYDAAVFLQRFSHLILRIIITQRLHPIKVILIYIACDIFTIEYRAIETQCFRITFLRTAHQVVQVTPRQAARVRVASRHAEPLPQVGGNRPAVVGDEVD